MKATFVHSNETIKKILFIDFKQFQIARGQGASGQKSKGEGPTLRRHL